MTAPFEVAPRRPSPAISSMPTMTGAGAADVLETKGVDAVAKSEAPAPAPTEPTRMAPPKPKPRRRIPRPSLQNQYIYAHPALTLNSILAAEAARPVKGAEADEAEIDWRLLAAAATKRGCNPSVTSNDTALFTPAMSVTSLASTLVDRASVHSSITAAGSQATSTDRYGWEESLSARSSLDLGARAGEETERGFSGGADMMAPPPAAAQERGFMGKRGLLWKVLTMNARGV
ncbi:hypothetical protein VC83_03870 [Pseudogymnoascus destructans]|uniref:Uncharacterized protein n=2 Tax=Pseudogymnoascus destructans TaxID=655981 RepID=L8G6D4_PSED2|nr:uncharacterized protein VC83_03870 [Pseudogymnoascus destructans]ELR08652.1 hypothetical protein GMDG_03338 [Pseudogymnoascus destructans 20631-21]OAF59834.1 hypothetical protein VC83_03870 [Pseudogymnoascus destructans]